MASRRSARLRNRVIPPLSNLPPGNISLNPTLQFQSTVDMANAGMVDTHEFLEKLAFSLLNKVTHLNGKNYSKWKRDMELRLRSARLLVYLSQVPETDEQVQKDAIALINIIESCEPDQ